MIWAWRSPPAMQVRRYRFHQVALSAKYGLPFYEIFVHGE
jgi:hypothetical protein